MRPLTCPPCSKNHLRPAGVMCLRTAPAPVWIIRSWLPLPPSSRSVTLQLYATKFPYMERRGRRPDPPQLAQATVRAAVARALDLLPGLPLIAGGKSFGGRMTSQAQASAPLPRVRGLVFVGFPLHPAGHPSQERAKHLFQVQIPMLFLQGARDQLASLEEIRALGKKLGKRATLKVFEGADYSFHLPARSGRKDRQVLGELVDALAAWADELILRTTPHPTPRNSSKPGRNIK